MQPPHERDATIIATATPPIQVTQLQLHGCILSLELSSISSSFARKTTHTTANSKRLLVWYFSNKGKMTNEVRKTEFKMILPPQFAL